LGDAFTFVAAPAPDAASITPITGPAGTGFTLNGVNFATTPGVKVLFGTTEATGLSVNGAGTAITGSVQGTVGLKDVTVRNPDGQEDTLTGAFTITAGTTTTGTGTTTGTTSQTITATQTSTPTTTTTTSSPQPVTHDVSIQNSQFTPQELDIAVGDTVRWTNFDSFAHTATSLAGATETFDSGNLPNGATFSFTFTAAGDNPYFCKIHPTMRGTITVA
jgi:plastocyanin